MTQLPYDITRCVAVLCGKRKECARFMDSPTGNDYQSYSDLSSSIANGECGHFIQYKPTEK